VALVVLSQLTFSFYLCLSCRTTKSAYTTGCVFPFHFWLLDCSWP